MPKDHILKNLHSLIRNSALAYMNEFIWQDIELTTEFKTAFSDYLRKNGSDVEFLGATAVITSSSTKYIFVPNQWFVIASYTVDVLEELQRYKNYFKIISDRLGKQPDEYAKKLRDAASSSDKTDFIDCAKGLFRSFCSDEERIEESASRLWRFVNDYAWWSGKKTIDRGDFYVSVILNMLNLVNASQGYVADIVNAYVTDHRLRSLVKTVDSFTVNLDTGDNEERKAYTNPDEEIGPQTIREEPKESVIPKPERVKIKISGSNVLKEIRYKG